MNAQMTVKQGVLLVNLGMPDDTSVRAIRRYLTDFLIDRRVVNISPALWLPILYSFILPFRPKRLVANYAAIEIDGKMPVHIYNKALAQNTEANLQQAGHSIRVISAMTYGNPSIQAGLETLQSEQIEEVLIIPLFPQYCAVNTAASFDKLAAALAKKKNLPKIKIINQYFAEPDYIAALATSIENAATGAQTHASVNCSEYLTDDTKLLFCFNGIRKRQVDGGDPYPRQCVQTAEAIAAKLKLSPYQWLLTYQPRIGAEEWLQPFTSDTLKNLPAQGVKKLLVICPGFAADCLETLEEIDIENKAVFMQAGGVSYNYIPCLNDQQSHVELMKTLIMANL